MDEHVRTHREVSLAEVAFRGAIGGIAGGIALIASERLLMPRIDDRRPRIVSWDKRLQRTAQRIGWEMSPRVRTASGIATQILASAVLGAAYELANARYKPTGAAKGLLDAGLMFVASLLAPELPKKDLRRKRKKKRGLLGRIALDPITTPALYGEATTLAVRALRR
jgi:hypothetical protein